MKKTFFKTFLLGCIAFQTNFADAQNPSWILAPNYWEVGQISTQPLPTVVGGYQGAAATGAQNIVTDANGQIIFFIVNDYIYDKGGNIIDQFTLGIQSNDPVNGTNSEVIIVKDQNDCNVFHLFSTRFLGNVTAAEPVYAKLRVSYNSQGQLNPNSGLYYSDIEDCYSNLLNIIDLLPSNVYFSDNSPGSEHDQNPFIAVAPPNNNGVQKVYVIHHSNIFCLTLNSTGLTYNHYIDLNVVFGSSYGIAYSGRNRHEFEVIKLLNGNFRIGCFIDYVDYNSTVFGKNGIAVFDVDANGNHISGTQKICGYNTIELANGTGGDIAKITGIEFSPLGNNLFVTHAKYTTGGNSTLDYWDLTSSIPTRTTLSTNTEFQTSQIEAAVDGSLMLPRQNYLAKISNPDGTPTLNETAIPISTYNATTNNQRSYVRLLQDQVDGENYSSLTPGVYNAFSYNVTTSGTWKPNTIINGYNNNPLVYGLGNTVYIEKELRIKAGVDLTIEDMIFKFSPGARVVIENGFLFLQGGKLTLNNVVFTNDDNCGKDELWLGVEVWGNQTSTQGSISNSTQGRLIMTDSKIENASVGVLVSKRNSTFGGIPVYNTFCEPQPGGFLEVVSPFSFDDNRNGGIVQATSSEFLNNQRGVWFRPYGATSNTNNLSYFYTSDFIWNDDILISTQDLVKLETVLGINFKGCNFKNEITTGPYYQSGYGIYARESQFYVNEHTGPIPNVFQNLNYGIRTWNLNSLTFSCNDNNFVDNRYGIYVQNTKGEQILNNTFAIRENASLQSAGISLYNSTGYQVRENELFEHDNPLITNGSGNSYGIVVNNSGETENEIYKNYFHNLKIGGQTEGINGTEVPFPSTSSISGLQWLCNDFQHDIYDHDLTLISGRMNYHQGSASVGTTYLERKRGVANNKFSLTGESPADEHDIFVSSNSHHLTYSYTKAPRLEPDSYTLSPVIYGSLNLDEALWIGDSITEDADVCPSKRRSLIGPFPFTPLFLIMELENSQNELRSKIDNSNTDGLLALIDTDNDVEIKNALMEASPYLSDEVLIAYINSNPSATDLKQVMIANSGLSEKVKEVLVKHKMPIGTANQIAEAQSKLSKMEELYSEISYLEHQIETEYTRMIGQTMLDDSDTANIENLILLLKEIGDYDRTKILLSTYISMGDNDNAEKIREVLQTMNASPDFLELTKIQESISPNRTVADALIESPEIVSQIEGLLSTSEDQNIKMTAQYMLESLIDSDEVPAFLTASKAKSSTVDNQQKTEIDLHRNFNVSIYPNPTTGIVNFDYPDNNEGTMEIQIISLDGKIKAEFIAKDSNGEQFNVSHLNKGYYLVKIKLDGQEVETQKLEIF